LSHFHERSEKICLNCGAALYGRYCHVCGQENVEPRESTGHLFRHFFEDLTHFDGKFFSTLKLLITKPGFLSAEYIKGRRASYLNPIRMYLFISFIFFFALFAFPGSNTHVVKQPVAKDKLNKINYSVNMGDESPVKIITDTINTYAKSKNTVETLAEYKAQQDSLPPSKRDGAIEHFFAVKAFSLSDALASGDKEYLHRAKEKFFHLLPQMFYVILPFFAFFLYLLYIRRRKEYNYVAHAIFTVHFYCFVFIAWLAMRLVGLIPFAGRLLELAILIYIWIYLFRAMRNFYKQGGGKTFLKFILLDISTTILLAVLSVIYIATAMTSAI